MSSSNKKSPRPAPPAVRPQSVARKTPVAPPVYRPQATPKVLQTKKSSTPTAQSVQRPAQKPAQTPAQKPRQPVAPPVYRPEAKKIVQPKAVLPARTVPQKNRPGLASPAKQRGGGVVMLMEMRRRGGGKTDDEVPKNESPKSEIRIEERKAVPQDDDKASWSNNPCNFQAILNGSFGQSPVSLGRFDGLTGKAIRRGATLYRGSPGSGFDLSNCDDNSRVYFTSCKARADAIGNTMQFTVIQSIPVVYTGNHGGDHVEDDYLSRIGAYYSSKECEVVMLGKVAKNCLQEKQDSCIIS